MCAGVPAWAHIAANKTDSLLCVDDVTVTEAPCATQSCKAQDVAEITSQTVHKWVSKGKIVIII